MWQYDLPRIARTICEEGAEQQLNHDLGGGGSVRSPLESEGHVSRSYPVHGVRRTSDGPTIVFLTVCSKYRNPWIADDAVHVTLRKVWTDATAWLVGDYVLMPDHIHLFATPSAMDIPLDNWVRYWKSQFTRADGNPNHLWQRNHWDTRIRSSESYVEKREYVLNNPVRKGLVENPGDWVFKGRICRCDW